ncbi:hypothetical protein FA13DRAFT_1797778 [Coprinellus micaceus]|uniref:Protein kinase domain-containing protein n=1 Tax=Coprinellus micaceus TaxID=71717 RepID=A0A4Y7SPM6_COPMI|nr:hypothetical protein FA13DRAFT_1797778 [Coprinellus micaceus]
MAPELLNDHCEDKDAIPTAASDIYSFALLAYEVFTNEKPFQKIRAQGCPGRAILMLFDAILKGNERPAKPAEGSTAYTHYGMMDGWKMIEDCLVPDPNKRPPARDILKRPFMAGKLQGYPRATYDRCPSHHCAAAAVLPL